MTTGSKKTFFVINVLRISLTTLSTSTIISIRATINLNTQLHQHVTVGSPDVLKHNWLTLCATNLLLFPCEALCTVQKAMADIHQWRRMVQPNRSRSQDLRGAQELCAESGDVGSMSRTRRFSTEHLEAQPVRLRPKSRLASYLGTHRSFSVLEKPDGATFSASSTNDKDDVYDPDPLQMSYTIQKRLLAFPAEGLPAQHNSLLMHLIEAFHDLSVDRLELLEKLNAEKKSHEAALHHFERNEISWLEERETYRLKIVNLESVFARRGCQMLTGPAVANSQADQRAESVDSLVVTSKDMTPRREGTSESDCKGCHLF